LPAKYGSFRLDGIARLNYADVSRRPAAPPKPFVKEREDVAASIFLIFGVPGFVGQLEPVPTLR